jgi:hypothetical protein
MTTLKATVRNGRIELDEPFDLPDGAEVEVILLTPANPPTLRGMTEEEQGTTPEAIERWIAILEAISAPAMSDDEWAAWMQRRREDRGWELARAEEREARLRKSAE